ncbi:chloramphenicol-sensitive protein RarD [Noviherbaspirillum humi]|uniref:Chloramphenicol-sensitive protein RarD n=1 Tax=Noviherbaspirillum humi TaxID=1688639 RepID=A0A239BPQ8_9BURK|nr:EamA family transporter RarD [Noviherbaspirillum humi]SNS10077.1 chloramphenicol-sensitive protein RarD [Noviherbaspirillum humi]
MQLGMLYAALAYVIWGAFPVYFKSLQAIPSIELVPHRMLWSLAFLFIVLAARRQWTWLGQALRRPKLVAGFLASSLLLSSNWFVYVWAVNNGRVVDASLGYFINPLVNVLLGYVVLGERMRPVQWLAIALAAAGVLWLTWIGGQLPWIALSLAATFGLYGLLRKTAVLGPLEGLALETLLVAPLALAMLLWLSWQGQTHFAQAPLATQLLMAAAGPITAIPLLLFAAGARRIPLSVLGLLQYIGPTLQLLLGVWLYHEPFGGARLAGFALIWCALAVYSAEGVWQRQATRLRQAS